MEYLFDWKEYASYARQAAAEGCVLLKNDDLALPIKKGEKVSVFGRIQSHYYKSGTGSGGMVNAPYVVSILDGLKSCQDIFINQDLAEVYAEWEKQHPFDLGAGWAMEPWSQEEMPLSEELVKKAAAESDLALIIIGRTAGEDQDNSNTEGSYLLTIAEKEMICTVCSHFTRTAVVLNTGNIMDMKWVDTYQPKAVLYVWQGGMEGGNAAADILTGKYSPSGKLSDTIAEDINDYPSTSCFGDAKENEYREDIYVGYRYFETVAKEKVKYPFGFGLSYTSFDMISQSCSHREGKTKITVMVHNTGEQSGKEVVQVYICPPQGLLGKPLRNLAAFEKTKELLPGESQIIQLEIEDKTIASYDDSGVTGYPYSYVLEAGTYEVYVGNNVRSAQAAGKFTIKECIVIEKLTQAGAPVKQFMRLKPFVQTDEFISMTNELVPLLKESMSSRRKKSLPNALECTGNKNYLLADVYHGKISMEEFLAQIPDEDLICLAHGEGMCSPKVTPGTASCFGGVTDCLTKWGIPAACCADGPSGIRMDCGSKAFSLPNGTLLACTFNTELAENLYRILGMELRKNQIDTILGPGMNIHRNPLNGRNFEYFSEDPYLTGKMAAAELKGLHFMGVTGTIKHFACNNQEYKRNDSSSVVSERALREIYLKGFEIAVKEAEAYSVMSTYGALNGVWTAGHYDLLTTILRNEWKFDGIVMTDWWAKVSEEGTEAEATRENSAAMIKAQNDLYMVVADAKNNKNVENALQALKNGEITRGELLRSAANICRVIIKLPVMKRFLSEDKDIIQTVNEIESKNDREMMIEKVMLDQEAILSVEHVSTKKGSQAVYGLQIAKQGNYVITLTMRSDSNAVAQMPVSIFINNHVLGTITINGTNGEWVQRKIEFKAMTALEQYLKFYFGESGILLKEIRINRLDK